MLNFLVTAAKRWRFWG